MTQITLNIEDDKLKTFMAFIKTLSYVSLDKKEQVDENELRKAIDEGIESLEKHGGIPHEQVMVKMKKKYPNFFRA